MKRIFILIAAVIAVWGITPRVEAANNNYTLTLGTYAVVGSTENFVLGAYPNISGDVIFKKLILSNDGSTVQTITLYENATSTSAGSEFMTVVLPSTGTTVISFTNRWTGSSEAELANLAITKSAIGSVVDATIFYSD